MLRDANNPGVSLVGYSKSLEDPERTLEEQIVHYARVSRNEKSEKPAPPEKLIRYLIRNRHWSPFEMVTATFLIECPRIISRQIIRHWSFSFQEFSQRYSEVTDDRYFFEARIQDKKSRQITHETDDEYIHRRWKEIQQEVDDFTYAKYQEGLDLTVGKESARSVLPEGLSPSKLFMTGPIRSWIHFIQVREDITSQKEVRAVAEKVRKAIKDRIPNIIAAIDEPN